MLFQAKQTKRNYSQWIFLGTALYMGFMAGIVWPDKPCGRECHAEILEQQLTMVVGQLEPSPPKPVRKP